MLDIELTWVYIGGAPTEYDHNSEGVVGMLKMQD